MQASLRALPRNMQSREFVLPFHNQRVVLLSVHMTPNRTALSCVVREATITADGTLKEGNALETLATADAVNGKFTPGGQALVNAITDALAKFSGAF